MTQPSSRRLLLIANDMGGANALWAAAPALSDASFELHWCATGAAQAFWSQEGAASVEAIAETSWLADHLRHVDPAVIVTGTSLGADLERLAWTAARAADIGSLAFIDARMNYRRRMCMTGRDEMGLPDALGVVDATMHKEMVEEGVVPKRVHVIGQPHLERVVARLRPARALRPNNARPLLAFLSEGIFERLQGDLWPGFDQFSVATLLVEALRDAGDFRLVVLPHPSESEATWHTFLSTCDLPANVEGGVGGIDRDRLLCEADGIIGMTTMMLVEAALIHAPVLSLQPARRRVANPLIEECRIDVVTLVDEVPAALARFLQDLKRPPPSLNLAIAEDAIRRMVLAVEAEVGISIASGS